MVQIVHLLFLSIFAEASVPTLNSRATRFLERFLERDPLRHPRCIYRSIERFDESSTPEIVNHVTRQWRRNWSRNIIRFRQLPAALTEQLHAAFDESPSMPRRRAVALSDEIETRGLHMSPQDVVTWFKTMQIQEKMRAHAREIRRRLQMQIEDDIRASLYPPPLGPNDPFLLLIDTFAFDPLIGL